MHPKFAPATDFHAELKARVDAYFARAGTSPRGGVRLWTKTGTIACWLAASYITLVFLAEGPLSIALAALSTALAIAAVGFNIQHDANHGAFSDRSWVNRAMGYALDAIGGSSYIWFYKHNVYHHTYTNLAGVDDDISIGILGRLSPAQRRLPFHRFQQFYLWPLYAVMGVKWQLYDDFFRLARGRLGEQPLPRPKGKDLALLIVGKLFFFGMAFGVPAWIHPIGAVIAIYLAVMGMVGVVLAVVFQLAHSVGEADHPLRQPAPQIVQEDWARHQVQTTVNFARGSRVIAWYVGGLNFQIEHHLFPRVSHVHYPAISAIVEDVSRRFGVRYSAHPTFASALVAHYRFLREMGRGAA